MVTPEQWRKPDHWKHGLDPDPLHVPEPQDMSTEDVDRRVAKLIGAAIVLGAILLVIREALP